MYHLFFPRFCPSQKLKLGIEFDMDPIVFWAMQRGTEVFLCCNYHRRNAKTLVVPRLPNYRITFVTKRDREP